MAIGLTTSELGRYVNKTTRDQLQNYKMTAVDYYKSLPESGEGGAEGEAPATPAPGRHKRPAKNVEEAPPPEKEAPAPPARRKRRPPPRARSRRRGSSLSSILPNGSESCAPSTADNGGGGGSRL